jgi:hypothetical protein
LEAGFDATSLLEQAALQGPRDILRANTQKAKDLGLCGVPSYRVWHATLNGWENHGGVIWGQDETNVVLDLISGWEDTMNAMATVASEHEVHGISKL